MHCHWETWGIFTSCSTTCGEGKKSRHRVVKQEALNGGSEAWLVQLDLSAAFDTIDHTVLIDKLKLYGLDDGAIRWFKNYFSDRAQYCEIGAARSTIIKILHGVFQGDFSIPLL